MKNPVMKHIWRSLTSLLLVFCCLPFNSQALSAQEVWLMRDVFKTMPDSIVPYLSENNRLDMIDYMDSNMQAEVKNGLDGKSMLRRLDTDYLSLHLNEASDIEMRLLPYATLTPDSCSQVLCVVYTVGKTLRSSSVTFYSPKWLRLDAAQFAVPTGHVLASRPDTMSVEHYEELSQIARSVIMEYRMEADSPQLTAIPHVLFVTPEERHSISSILTTKSVKWNGFSFKND